MKRNIFKGSVSAMIVGGLTALSAMFAEAPAGAQTYNDYYEKPPYVRRPPTQGRAERPSRSRGDGTGAAIGFGIGLGLSIIEGVSRQNQMQRPPEAYRRPPVAPPPRQGYRPAPRKPSVNARPPRPSQRVLLPETLRVARAKPRVYSIGDKPWASDTEFVVVMHPGLTEDEVKQFVRDYGLELMERNWIKLLDQVVLKLKYPEDMSPRDALELATDSRVFRAQPDYYYYPSSGGQTAATRPYAELQYAFDRLGLAHSATDATGDGVRLAVIDSVINSAHPALTGAVSLRFSAFDEEATVLEAPEHGTAIASIIAAKAGMKGISDAVSLLSAEVFRTDDQGMTVGDSFDIVEGIDWAVQQGADILNLSFAGARDDLLELALAKASEQGVVLIAAAGNEGAEVPVAFPAAYAPVIAVTATDDADVLYAFANQGDDVDLAAPGVDILVAAGDDGFALQSGTSMAKAYISGAVALLLQKEPDLTVEDIKQRLSGATLDLGPQGRDPQYGYGRLDVSKVLDGPDGG